MTTFWRGDCPMGNFSAPLTRAKEIITRMLSAKAVLVNLRKVSVSFALSFGFLNGLTKGVKEIEFLSPAGEAWEKNIFSRARQNFFFCRLSSQIFIPGCRLFKPATRIKKIPSPAGRIFFTLPL